MKLYDINADIQELIYLSTDTMTGEFKPDAQVEEALEALEIEQSEKVLNIACIIKSLEAEADAHKVEELKQKAKRKVLNNNIERMKNYLRDNLEVGDNFNDSRISVVYRENGQQKVVIDDNQDVDPIFCKPFEIDKALVKRHLIEYKDNKLELVHNFAHLEPSDPSLVIK